MPDPATADLLVRWTARLAIGAYLVRAGWDLSTIGDRDEPLSRSRLALAVRWTWTVGWLIYLVHVLLAFVLIHHGSHAEAWRHVADETERLTGFRSGAGLVLDHLVSVLWTFDVAMWWRDPGWPRTRQARWLLHPFFSFMAFNATVVFGPPEWRLVAVVCGVAVGVWAMQQRIRAFANDAVQVEASHSISADPVQNEPTDKTSRQR